MNIVMENRASWPSRGLRDIGIVSAHRGTQRNQYRMPGQRQSDMVNDRSPLHAAKRYVVMTDYGFYHETYEKDGSEWLIKTLRIERIRVESA